MKNHIFIKNKINNFNEKIKVSSDKSISIRSILLASQSVGISKISNLLESEDVLNTLRTIKKLGINYYKKKKIYYIEGYGLNGFNIKKKNYNKLWKFWNISSFNSWSFSKNKKKNKINRR